MSLPKISVVIPSFNQDQFIRQTIDSILGQQYPNLELIIRDGGSSDQTVEVIESYGSQITSWVSQPDGGQAAAINEGFAIATGDILGWLNSDDMYMPQALNRISQLMTDAVETPCLVFGGCLHFREKSNSTFGYRPPLFDAEKLRCDDYIVQPSTFWTRRLWEVCGPLDTSLHYAFDWEWFIRASRHCEFKPCAEYLSLYRFHEAHKSGTGGEKRVSEIVRIAEKYSPGDWPDVYRGAYESLPRIRSIGRRLAPYRLGRFQRMMHPLLSIKYGRRFWTAVGMLKGTGW